MWTWLRSRQQSRRSRTDTLEFQQYGQLLVLTGGTAALSASAEPLNIASQTTDRQLRLIDHY
jgi:hypothetical protein